MSLSDNTFQAQYRTNEDDLIGDFYRPALSTSVLYERAVGYFRSSVYLIIGDSTVQFAKLGGKIKLLCSPSMSKEDVESISQGHEIRARHAEDRLREDLAELLRGDETRLHTQILATLVAANSLEVRIALRPTASGIYHEKIGIFSDRSGNAVSFIGSANETWNGWHSSGNHEAIEVFRSWSDRSEFDRVSNHRNYFSRLWEGKVPGVDVIELPEAVRQDLIQHSLGSLETVNLLPAADTSPPKSRKPMKHQIEAIAAWNGNDRRGVLEHATGSGKTFLALTAMKDHLDTGPVLILVPSSLLLKQWAQEAAEEYPGATVLKCGAGYNTWASGDRLKSMTARGPELGQRIVVSTMRTAATENFLNRVSRGDHLMIVADEVHQIGSAFNSQAMSIATGPRLGLSATPTRHGDPDGTSLIHNYFGRTLPPPFTLEDAIKAGRLVPYEYFPHEINLSAEEADSWTSLTKKISLEVARSGKDLNGQRLLSERAKMLLIQRSRIAKKAQRKVSLAAEVVSQHYEEGQRWLIYCEDIEQMRAVLEALAEEEVRGVEYHSDMAGDPVATLGWFKVSGGVLVSIKCLDEGVDIPAADHALILASSQNPRQFIQRRGRVLRKAQGKYKAVIHDVLVAPICVEHEPDQTSLLKSEMKRAIQFAKSALNRSAESDLRSIALHAGIDPDEIDTSGYEED